MHGGWKVSGGGFWVVVPAPGSVPGGEKNCAAFGIGLSIGDLEIRLDSGREVRFNVRKHAHLDHGYAVTSHSSQGQTAERV